jgi:MFS family permease
MLSADAARALIVLFIPLAHYFNLLNPLFLALNAFALAIAAIFFAPARDAIIPQLVPETGLMRANSLIQTSWQLSLLLGPALAGLLVNFVGNVHLLTVTSAFYLTSFFFVLFVQPKPWTTIKSSSGSGLTEIKAGLSFILKHKIIFPLLLLTILDNIFIMGPAIVGTPVFVRQELKLGIDAYARALFCYAVGMLLGTLILLNISDRFKKGKILLLAMALDGFTFVPFYYVRSLLQMEIAIIVHSLVIPLLTVPRTSIIQKTVPTEYTGRVFALVNLSVVGMTAISSAMTGFALEIWGARLVYFVIGIAGGGCGLIGWFWAKNLRRYD